LNTKIDGSEMLALDMGFKIEGRIRDVFDQKNWERAYNKHDNIFRVVIEIEIRSGRKTILSTKLVRKAVLFWTRNPKIQHRIWVQIVKDDSSFYPLSLDEARTLLFDFNKTFEIEGGLLKIGNNKVSAKILVYWGKHLFTEPQKISGKSEDIEVSRSS
jgi:hypothetical protein